MAKKNTKAGTSNARRNSAQRSCTMSETRSQPARFEDTRPIPADRARRMGDVGIGEEIEIGRLSRLDGPHALGQRPELAASSPAEGCARPPRRGARPCPPPSPRRACRRGGAVVAVVVHDHDREMRRDSPAPAARRQPRRPRRPRCARAPPRRCSASAAAAAPPAIIAAARRSRGRAADRARPPG